VEFSRPDTVSAHRFPAETDRRQTKQGDPKIASLRENLVASVAVPRPDPAQYGGEHHGDVGRFCRPPLARTPALGVHFGFSFPQVPQRDEDLRTGRAAGGRQLVHDRGGLLR